MQTSLAHLGHEFRVVHNDVLLGMLDTLRVFRVMTVSCDLGGGADGFIALQSGKIEAFVVTRNPVINEETRAVTAAAEGDVGVAGFSAAFPVESVKVDDVGQVLADCLDDVRLVVHAPDGILVGDRFAQRNMIQDGDAYPVNGIPDVLQVVRDTAHHACDVLEIADSVAETCPAAVTHGLVELPADGSDLLLVVPALGLVAVVVVIAAETALAGLKAGDGHGKGKFLRSGGLDAEISYADEGRHLNLGVAGGLAEQASVGKVCCELLVFHDGSP